MISIGGRRTVILAILALVVAPLLFLGPSVFGSRTFVPFDLSQFPPVSTTLTAEERSQLDEFPSNWDVTEIPALVVPEMELARAETEAGRFPAWNPYARFGAPLYANGLAAMAYPPNQLLLMRGEPKDGLALAAWLSFAIAGLLCFGFLRELRLSVPSALFGALVFALGGTLAANGHFYMRMNALIWLPGMAWATLRIGDRIGAARLPATVALAVCAAMTLLAGFPPFAVASLIAAGLFSTCVLARILGLHGPTPMLRVSTFILGGVALGITLAAVQLLPMFAFFPESNREITSGLDALRGEAFASLGYLGYVAPDLFGYPGELPTYQESPLVLLLQNLRRASDGALQYPPNYNLTEYAVFLGSLPLLLALLGAFGPGRRGRIVLVFTTLALFVLASAPNALATWYGLPVVGSVPPMRYVGPCAFLLAALSAFGLENVLENRAARRTAVIAGLAVVGSILCVYFASNHPLGDHAEVVDALLNRYRPGAPTLTREVIAQLIGQENLAAASQRLVSSLHRASWALLIAGVILILLRASRRTPRVRAALMIVGIAVTLGELHWFGAPLNSGRTILRDVHDTEVHHFLRDCRDARSAEGGITVARAGTTPREPVDLPSGSLFPERIRDLNAYAFVDAWSSRAFQALYGSAQMIRGYWPKSFPDDARLQLPFFDLIGLRYVLSTEQLDHAGEPTAVAIRGTEGSFFVYERPNALPRAFVVGSLTLTPDDDDAARALIAPDLDPRAAAVATPDQAAILGSSGEVGARDRAVAFVSDRTDAVVLEVEPGTNGYLVLADAALSGWSATVDGKPAPIARVNLFMRAVALPADARNVEFRYTPPGLAPGAGISGVGLLLLVALLAVAFRSSRRTDRADPSA